MNTKTKLSSESLLFLFRISNIFLLISILFSWKLWFSVERFIPVVPTFQITASPYISIICSGLLVISIVYNIFRFNKVSQVISLTLIILLCFLDRLKCQPWLYVYFTVLLIIYLNKTYSEFKLVRITKIIIGIIIIWSGIHKLSDSFYNSIVSLYNLELGPITYVLKTIPYLEILTGVFIIHFRKRLISDLVGISFHFLLILFILLQNQNFIIIIWNLFFILIYVAHYLLREENYSYKFWRNKSVTIVILLFSILPVLSYSKYYDQYFSFSLYSGKPSLLFLIVENETLEDPQYSFLKKYKINRKQALERLRISEDKNVVSFYKLSLDQFSVPLVTESDVILYLKEYYSKRLPKSELLTFKY